MRAGAGGFATLLEMIDAAAHIAPHLSAVLLWLQTRAARSTTFTLVRKVGGIGLVPLGILDGSPVPTFGSLDLLTAWLAARDPELWPYYAAMATLGGIVGAWLTYRLGERAGTRWLSSRMGERRAGQISSSIEHWGAGAVLVATLAPPPFPAALFFLAAGAAHYAGRKFAAAVVAGRAIRYAIVAAIGGYYGRHILRYFRHPAQYLVPSLAITSALIAAAAIALFYRRRWQAE
ncbi:MAG: VTT domain-containing protein [Acidobacteria bacterium]|nr:VTT domain-containing protein [Acidobacteriota bacterium]